MNSKILKKQIEESKDKSELILEIKDLTTRKLTSASKSALRISRKASCILSCVNSDWPVVFEIISCNFSANESNIHIPYWLSKFKISINKLKF